MRTPPELCTYVRARRTTPRRPSSSTRPQQACCQTLPRCGQGAAAATHAPCSPSVSALSHIAAQLDTQPHTPRALHVFLEEPRRGHGDMVERLSHMWHCLRHAHRQLCFVPSKRIVLCPTCGSLLLPRGSRACICFLEEAVRASGRKDFKHRCAPVLEPCLRCITHTVLCSLMVRCLQMLRSMGGCCSPCASCGLLRACSLGMSACCVIASCRGSSSARWAHRSIAHGS